MRALPKGILMYALAVVPLIRWLRAVTAVVPDACQVWFADDATVVGSLPPILDWWWHLSSVEPKFGYFPNASKTVFDTSC